MGVEDETIVHPLNQNIIAAQLLTIDDHSYGNAEVQSSTAAHIYLNTKNIVLVHDGWADGSSRSKEMPISKERRTTVDYCTTC